MIKDIRGIAALIRRVYTELPPYKQSEIRGQINNFPDGCFVALLDDEVVGYCASMQLPEPVAFAPHDAPRYAIALIIQHAPAGGSADAAPRAREVMKVALLKDPDMRARIEQLDAIEPALGGRIVARAWVDPDFKRRLLEDGTAAIAELGFGGAEGAAFFDVPVARRRVVRCDAKRHDHATFGGRNGNVDGTKKLVPASDNMVRRRHQHDRIRIFLGQHQCRQGRRRRGIPSDGLKNDGLGGDADLAQLFGDDEPMLVVANHQRIGEPTVAEPFRRFLKHASVGNEVDELLGIMLPGDRPKPLSRSARENYWNDRFRGHPGVAP